MTSERTRGPADREVDTAAGVYVQCCRFGQSVAHGPHCMPSTVHYKSRITKTQRASFVRQAQQTVEVEDPDFYLGLIKDGVGGRRKESEHLVS